MMEGMPLLTVQRQVGPVNRTLLATLPVSHSGLLLHHTTLRRHSQQLQEHRLVPCVLPSMPAWTA